MLAAAALFLALLGASSPAYATSQWSRKYEVSCSVCHTAFPRLNYFGERFLRNGFQWPDVEPDGDTEGKTEVGPDMFIDQLGNMLGFRLNLDAVRVRANRAVVGGEPRTQVNFGGPNWGQLFVAGSLFKNVSIFIENEFEGDAFKFTWFHFGFHNLGSKAINFQVGNLSPLEFASYPNRLRIMAPVRGDVFGVRTTGGAEAADNLSISGFRPGIQYYGYGGPVVWWAGVTPGKGTADVNDDRHYWGGIKFEIPADESDFQGSSVSVWTYNGTDGTPHPAAVGADIENDFDRVSLQGNLRWTNLDVQAAWVEASDDNWDLNPGTPTKVDFSGFSIVGAWQEGKWYPAVAYDKINQDDAPASVLAAARRTNEREFVTLSLSFHPRENWRIGAYGRIDLMSEDPTTHPIKTHDLLINIRTMF